MALKEMIIRKRQDISQREQINPLERFRENLAPSDRSLAAALSRPGLQFIMEYKKASPSSGAIAPTVSPQEIIRAYGPVADAISVLTDRRFFNGSFDDLRTIRDGVSQPVLCKDIVVSPYQVYEARYYGADAILLMLSVLSDDEYQRCAEVARALEMDIVTEIRNEAELKQALQQDAKIIGINNRNLDTLEVDTTTTQRLSPQLPEGPLVLSESGVAGEHDLQCLYPYTDAVLVGTSIMSSKRIDMAARTLVFGRVKVCGVTNADDAMAADEAGASYIGLNFYKHSPRCISLDAGDDIRSATALPLVGVFVNETMTAIAAIARELNLSAVQLHGDETNTDMDRLRHLLPEDCEIWKTLATEGVLPGLMPAADRHLLDRRDGQLRGGTGRTFNWHELKRSKERHQIILAGGLCPANAAAARAVGCWALDVNSGIECAPGLKDKTRMHAFFETLRLPDRYAQTTVENQPKTVLKDNDYAARQAI